MVEHDRNFSVFGFGLMIDIFKIGDDSMYSPVHARVLYFQPLNTNATW